MLRTKRGRFRWSFVIAGVAILLAVVKFSSRLLLGVNDLGLRLIMIVGVLFLLALANFLILFREPD